MGDISGGTKGVAGSGVSDSFLAAASADRKPNEKLNYGVILQGDSLRRC